MAKRLMEEARDVFRAYHYSYRTEVTYIKWIKRFIKYHGNRPPRELGPAEIQAFLTDLATRGKVSASTQNQALSSLLFLYKKVLKIDLPLLDEIVRAKRPVRVPIMLTRPEAAKVLSCMQGRSFRTLSSKWTLSGAFWRATGSGAGRAYRCRTRSVASTRTRRFPGVGNISSHQRIMHSSEATWVGADITLTRPACRVR